jgi:hypothetical protein
MSTNTTGAGRPALLCRYSLSPLWTSCWTDLILLFAKRRASNDSPAYPHCTPFCWKNQVSILTSALRFPVILRRNVPESAPGIGKLFLWFNIRIGIGIGIAGVPPGWAVGGRCEGSRSRLLSIIESSNSIVSQNKCSVKIDGKKDH